MPSLRIVNVVASGRIAEEFDPASLAIQLGAEYDPAQFPGVVCRIEDPKVAILAFRSGRIVCTGAKSPEESREGIDKLISQIQFHGIETLPKSQIFVEVVNIVATYNLGVPLNLIQLTMALSFEKVEYEPEQFPGLVYRLGHPKVVCLIFRSGKMVITGGRTIEQVREAIEIVKEDLAEEGYYK